MHSILPDASPGELIVDRIHRISKPPHLAASVPWDVLMRVHFFHIKEKLMTEARSKMTLSRPYEGLQLYPDLSKYTLQLRRNLNQITKGLHNHRIVYKWCYPATLLIPKNGTTHVVSDLKKGRRLLHEWGIILEPPTDGTPPLQQLRDSQQRRHQETKDYQHNPHT